MDIKKLGPPDICIELWVLQVEMQNINITLESISEYYKSFSFPQHSCKCEL